MKKGFGMACLFIFLWMATSPVKASFSDVSGSYARAEIEALLQSGYVTGYPNGSFLPANPMTRGEFAVILAKAMELPPDEKASSPFTDVPSWARPYVGALVSEKITYGISSSTFAANSPLTREEMAVFFTRAIGLEAVAQSLDLVTPFVDYESIDDWARPSVAFLQAIGFVKGAGSSYLPLEQAERQAMARLTYEYAFRFASYIPKVMEVTVKTETPDATQVSMLDGQTVQVTFKDGKQESYTLEEIIFGDYYYSIGMRTLNTLGIGGSLWTKLDVASKRQWVQIALGSWHLTFSPYQVMVSDDTAISVLISALDQFYGVVSNQAIKFTDSILQLALSNHILYIK